MSVVALVVIILVVYIWHYIAVNGNVCTSKVKLHGKTVIVTGSNTGIGKATAIELAKRGARVIMACRSKQRGEAACEEVKKESGSNQVVFMQLDLGSLQSVRTFAETFLKTEPRLDILINNAGVVMGGVTEDGFGQMFGVHHLGHFLLIHLLLDRLKQCGPSRIINVSSRAHYLGKVDFDCITKNKAVRSGDSFVQVARDYMESKLCNVLCTYELAKRLKGTNVTCYSVCPGAVRTDLDRNNPTFFQLLVQPFAILFFLNTFHGCQTSLHCALQEGIEPLSGRFFANCSVLEFKSKAKDDAAAKKLWEISERFCGI